MWEYSQRTHLMQSWSSARQCSWTAPVFTVYKKGTGGSLCNKDHQVRTLCRRHIDILQWKDTDYSRGLSVAATRLRTWLAERGLCINVNKTKAMLLPPKHQQCPADILIRCCDATLSIVNEYKYLGVIIDSTLSWEAHVDSVVSKVAKKIGTLRRAGNSLTQAARRQYYLSVIQSDLQYGTNAYWTTLTNARQNRLIRSSKRALRAVINAPTTTPTKTILSLLNLPPPPPP